MKKAENNRVNEPIGKDGSLPISDKRSYLWLAVGAAVLFFSNGMRIIPLSAWLGPVFMVRFLRTQKALRGLIIGYAVNTVLFYFQWQAAFQGAGSAFMLYTAAFGLIGFLPYAIDRLLRPLVKGFLSTLILPTAWVSCEYLLHLILPLGTFFSMAYTQSIYLPLLQIMSITGLWGVTFLVIWFAGMANFAWEKGFRLREIGRGGIIFAGILLAVVFYGGLRLAVFPPSGDTVRVALLTTNIDAEVLPAEGSEQEGRLLEGTLTSADREDLFSRMEAVNSDLMKRSRLQAQAGSRIIVWTEYDAHVFKGEEPQFLEECRALAREEEVYMAVPLVTVQEKKELRSVPGIFIENKMIMVTPEGEIAFQYTKANLLIGWEMEHAVRGPREIQTIDTPYGTLAGVICLDMDYPSFIRKAGRQGVDIILSGALDGTDNSGENPMHAVMASYRTIESGVSMARAGKYAQTMAVDYQGHTLAKMKHSSSDGRTLIAHVPVKGTTTLYTYLGDFFPWLCLLALAAMAVTSILRNKRKSIIIDGSNGNR